MGLDDLNEDQDLDETGSTKRQYEKLTREEVGEFFINRKEAWERADHPSREFVVETNDFMPEKDRIVLRVFTTIQKSTGVAAETGADAIRCVVWDLESDKPIAGREKTLRIKTWRKNLNAKIDDLMEREEELVRFCPDCQRLLTIRDGKYGKFYGCTGYPHCSHTEPIDK